MPLQTQTPIESEAKTFFPPKIFIILILLAGILGSYQVFYSIKSGDVFEKVENVEVKNELVATDTSNWKTYRNEEYGIELKYRSDWIVEYNETYRWFSILATTTDSNFNNGEVYLATIYTVYIRPAKEYEDLKKGCEMLDMRDTPDCRSVNEDLLSINKDYAFTYHNGINTDFPSDFDKQLFEAGIVSSKTFRFTK